MKLQGTLSAVLLFFSLAISEAQPLYVEEHDFFIDPPYQWQVIESSSTAVAFTDPGGSANFMIMPVQADPSQSIYRQYREVRNNLNASGDGREFSYLGRKAIFGEIDFTMDNEAMQGYLLLIKAKQAGESDTVLLTMCNTSGFSVYSDFLLSAMDSFSIDINGLNSPGPVSSYNLSTRTPGTLVQVSLNIENQDAIVPVSPIRVNATYELINREIRMLAYYTPNDIPAWQRYYRMIYRDSYHSIDSLFPAISVLIPRSDNTRETAERVLAWIQNFTYYRPGSRADIFSPLTAIQSESGDCDTLVLLYVILMKHYNIDAVMLVSPQFSHSVAAVSAPGEGARYPVDESEYLIAETTAQVDLGLIAAEQADVSAWFPVTFSP